MIKRWLPFAQGVAFAAYVLYSAYLAGTIWFGHCESFSCTYVGVAWIFWGLVWAVPIAIWGHFVQRLDALPVQMRKLLRYLWRIYTAGALGVLAWWLFQRLHWSS